MRNARACDAPGKDSIRHCPKGHVLTFTPNLRAGTGGTGGTAPTNPYTSAHGF